MVLRYPFLSAHGIFCLGQPPEQSENKENHAFSSSCGRTFSEIRECRFVLFQISTIPSVHLRIWLYKGLGVKMGKNVTIHFRTEVRCPERLTLGDGTIIGDNAILDARRGLTMGRNVNLSSNVSIYTLQHDHRDPNFDCPPEDKVKLSVEIDDRVWLGSNVIVLPGVHIGEGAVCCAGCVVTKDVEPYSVVAGIPAKRVSERPRNLTYNFKGKSCRFY